MKKRLSSGPPLRSRLLSRLPIWRAMALDIPSSSTTVNGLRQRLQVFTPPDAPVKILQLIGEYMGSGAAHHCHLLCRWVFGGKPGSHSTILNPRNSIAILRLYWCVTHTIPSSRNVWPLFQPANPLHGLTATERSSSGDWAASSNRLPSSVSDWRGRWSGGWIPAPPLQLHIDIQPGAEEQIYFVLGQAEDRDTALDLVRRYKDPGQVQAAWSPITACGMAC